MQCESCKSNRMISILAKCDDRFIMSYKGIEIIKNDYVPHNIGIGGGDYLNITFCLDCGKIRGDFPIINDHIEGLYEEVSEKDNEE